MELLINGKFTDKELKEAETLFEKPKVTVRRYVTKGVEFEDVVRAIFRDFDTLTLLRDGIIFEIILQSSRKLLRWAKGKRPKAEVQITFELSFDQSKPVVMIGIHQHFEENPEFIDQLRLHLTEDFFNSLKKGEVISILWDEDSKKVKIIRF